MKSSLQPAGPGLRGVRAAAVGLAWSAGMATGLTAGLDWEPLPDFPLPPGVAGAFGGIDNGVLIVAGGSNFQPASGGDLWEAPKLWRREVFVLREPGTNAARWMAAGELPEPAGNGASAPSPCGLVCLGGESGGSPSRQAFLLRWDGSALQRQTLPDLPVPGTCGAVAVAGRTVYFLTGQTATGLETADSRLWRLELPEDGISFERSVWAACPPLPGPGRAFAALVAQHNGHETALYAIGGRCAAKLPGEPAEPLREVFEYLPGKDSWRRRADAPVAIMAAPVVPAGLSQILVLGGDDGALMTRTAELKSSHPGFPRRSFIYDTATDTWTEGAELPTNQVASVTGVADGMAFVATGEVKPRHRTTACWRITLPRPAQPD